jgi:hypothetical protein
MSAVHTTQKPKQKPLQKNTSQNSTLQKKEQKASPFPRLSHPVPGWAFTFAEVAAWWRVPDE